MSKAPALFVDGELADAPGPIAQQAFDAWNAAAKLHGWPSAQALAAGRPAKLRRAVKDVGGLVNWRKLLEEAAKSPFLCGKVPGRNGAAPFRLSLDWLLQPRNLLKVMEKTYTPQTTVPTSQHTGSATVVDWRGRLANYRKGGFWPSSWSNRPETPGPWLAGPVHVAEWRKTHGVEEPQALAETAEQRLEASIASLRRIGQYDRANAAEEKLSRLQGRPPVLVPHPESASIGMPPKAPISRPMPKMTDIEPEPTPAPPDWVDEAPPPNPNDYE